MDQSQSSAGANSSAEISGDTGRIPAPIAVVQMRARGPWAAGVAGLLFAVLFTGALLLLRNLPINGMSDAAISDWFASGGDVQVVIGGLYLGPFAGIALIWFIAVVRDQIGEREDRFFATVFLGSGILLTSLLFAALAMVTSFVVGVRFLDQPPPSAETVAELRAISYTLIFAFATRAASVFMLTTTTVGARSGIFPRWLIVIGYVLALLLLLTVTFFDWVILVIPAWVALVSLLILRREWGRRSASNA